MRSRFCDYLQDFLYVRDISAKPRKDLTVIRMFVIVSMDLEVTNRNYVKTMLEDLDVDISGPKPGYFKYLNLKPGMELLDIGCGNCSWINYCRKRGIITTGLTLTKSQADFCKSKGINNIIVGDIHKNVLKTILK